MKYTTVSSLCEAVAESIRSKEGSTALINPQDFVDRINALQIGGGGDGEEYGVYLKILDVNTNIDGEVDTALTADSQIITEFFSDAFSLGETHYHYTGCPSYSNETIIDQLSKIVLEEGKKNLGLPNIYDTLQKKVPMLALRTKPSYLENGEVYWSEKILFLREVVDARNSGSDFYANSDSFYSNLGYDDTHHSACYITITEEGLRIINVE